MPATTDLNWTSPDVAVTAEGRFVIQSAKEKTAAGKADIPADLAEPMRRAALLIADLRSVIAEHAPVADFVMNAEPDQVSQRTCAMLERSLNRIFNR